MYAIGATRAGATATATATPRRLQGDVLVVFFAKIKPKPKHLYPVRDVVPDVGGHQPEEQHPEEPAPAGVRARQRGVQHRHFILLYIYVTPFAPPHPAIAAVITRLLRFASGGNASKSHAESPFGMRSRLALYIPFQVSRP